MKNVNKEEACASISFHCGDCFSMWQLYSVLFCAKLERLFYVIILGGSCKVLGKAKYEVEGSTSQLKFERFPALTPAACPLVLCVQVCCGFTLGLFVFLMSLFLWSGIKYIVWFWSFAAQT